MFHLPWNVDVSYVMFSDQWHGCNFKWKTTQNFFPARGHSKKTIAKYIFDGMKYFTNICTFLIVIYNFRTLVSLLKQVKVFGNQIDLNKKRFKLAI